MHDVTGYTVDRQCIDLYYNDDGGQWDDVTYDVTSKPKQDERT